MTRKFRSSLLIAAFITLAGGAARAQDNVVHVGQAEALKAAKEKFQPEYPPMARQLHLQGAVELRAHISESGSVEDVKPLSGNPVLMNAAIVAIRRWKFKPFTEDGKPSKAIADLSFDFKL